MFLLHAHGGECGHWWEEILLEGLIDTLKIIPFLFLTYLLMEFIEHKAGERAESFMKRAGGLAPMVGGALGLVPQCGFSAAALPGMGRRRFHRPGLKSGRMSFSDGRGC